MIKISFLYSTKVLNTVNTGISLIQFYNLNFIIKMIIDFSLLVVNSHLLKQLHISSDPAASGKEKKKCWTFRINFKWFIDFVSPRGKKNHLTSQCQFTHLWNEKANIFLWGCSENYFANVVDKIVASITAFSPEFFEEADGVIYAFVDSQNIIWVKHVYLSAVVSFMILKEHFSLDCSIYAWH